MEDLTQALIVHVLTGSRLVVEAADSWQLYTLGPLGFQLAPALGPNYWVHLVQSEIDRLYVTRELVGWQALFVEGPGWSPNAVLEQYEEEGKLDGTWRSLYWTGPGQPHIRALARPARPTPPQPSSPAGCATCLSDLGHGQDSRLSLGSSAYRYAGLFRCQTCGTWWEAGDRFARTLTPGQAAEFYPTGYRKGLQLQAPQPPE